MLTVIVRILEHIHITIKLHLQPQNVELGM